MILYFLVVHLLFTFKMNMVESHNYERIIILNHVFNGVSEGSRTLDACFADKNVNRFTTDTWWKRKGLHLLPRIFSPVYALAILHFHRFQKGRDSDPRDDISRQQHFQCCSLNHSDTLLCFGAGRRIRTFGTL